jgi:hypothetical protein
VPFLAPYHFGGTALAYADIDGMMISALSDITVSIDRIAGRRLDASGALIEANPGIYRPADPKLIKRPELAVDYSTIGRDFLLSVPTAKQDNDYLQFGLTFGDDYSLKWLYGFWKIDDSAAIDAGRPTAYTNLTLTGTESLGPLRFDCFSWLALDYYSTNLQVPWGMASVRVHPLDRNDESFLFGGSHQFFSKGKRVGNNAFLNRTYLSNGAIEGTFDSVVTGIVDLRLDGRIDYQDWSGSIVQRDPAGSAVSYSANGKELGGSVHGYIRKDFGPIEASTDLLFSGISYGTSYDAVVDAGISFLLDLQHFQAELHAGRITSRPDIRGLPDTSFRRQKLHSYVASLPVFFRSGIIAKIGIQPYLRFQDKCPRMNPLLFIWDTAATTPLSAHGVDIEGALQPFRWLALHGTLNLSWAQRSGAGSPDSLYEWNIPWTARTGMHCSFLNQRLHLYFDYILTKGIPYYDFAAKKYIALPNYGRADISLQYRTPMQPHRFLTRYDAYFEAHNLFDEFNIRDYYWGPSMRRKAIILCPFDLDMGLRAGFRL